MRAFSIRPAELRRISTSLTLISNFPAGSYAVFTALSAAKTRRDPNTDAMGKLAVPIAVNDLRKCRRPRACLFKLASMHNDRELCLAGDSRDILKSWMSILIHLTPCGVNKIVVCRMALENP